MEELLLKVKSGKTSWIQGVPKETLWLLVQELNLATNIRDPNIEDLRQIIRTYTKKFNQEESMTSQTILLPMPSSLENFNGGNWHSYQEQLNCYMFLHEIPQEKQVPLLLTKLTANVYDNLSGLCSPLSPLKFSYDNLCLKLEDFYHPKTNLAVHRAVFKDRNQSETESIKEYLLTLRKMTKDCQFKDVEEHLKERLLNGVHSDTIRYELLKIADKSLTELSTVAETA